MSTNSKRQGMAIASLVLGILSLFCFGLLAGIPAIILGHTALRRTRRAPEQYEGAGLAIAGFSLGYASLLTTFVLLGLMLPALAKAKSRAQSIVCVNNMKQIGLAFRIWSVNHTDRFPFNVPATEGGTLEPNQERAQGLEADPSRVFRTLAAELGSPKLLVCPADSSKQPASDFNSLRIGNITYELESGPDIDEKNPQEVLARCPIHGNELFCDGSVQQGLARRHR